MDSNDLKRIVERVIKVKDFSFSKNTTYACGGNATIAYYPNSVKQAAAVYDYLKLSARPFLALGNGSNVLASDGGYDGAIICTKKLKGVNALNDNSIFVYAGTTVAELLKFCVEYGFGGLEYLAGIPATIGGLVYMNGGAGGGYIGDNVQNVMLYDDAIHSISHKKCNFGYKYSTMRDVNSLILGVQLQIEPKNGENVRKSIGAVLERRKGLPKGASCGCVFKNAGELSAGKIIEDAGLKECSLGSAYVSGEHANFIINRGGSAADVYALIRAVKEKVYDKTGIMLEEEVIYIGDFK